MSRSRSLLARLLLMLGLCVWVIETAGVPLHRLLVQHAVCAEHGELVEIGESSQPEANATDTGPRIRAESPSNHDHCGLDSICLAGVALVGPSGGLLAPPWYIVEAAVAEQHAHRSVLTYAPKTSPPGRC